MDSLEKQNLFITEILRFSPNKASKIIFSVKNNWCLVLKYINKGKG